LDIFRQVREVVDNPPNLQEVKIKGDVKTGKETFSKIANSLSAEEQENFHFYPADYFQQRIKEEPTENPNEITEEIKAYREAAEAELKELMK
jgi:hypothetical protein